MKANSPRFRDTDHLATWYLQAAEAFEASELAPGPENPLPAGWWRPLPDAPRDA